MQTLQQQQQQQQQQVVSYNIDYFLFNEFNKRSSIYTFYKMTPKDFQTLSDNNKKLMIQKYYHEMKNNLFSNQGCLIILTVTNAESKCSNYKEPISI